MSYEQHSATRQFLLPLIAGLLVLVAVATCSDDTSPEAGDNTDIGSSSDAGSDASGADLPDTTVGLDAPESVDTTPSGPPAPPTVGEAELVVPSVGLPEEVVLQGAANNLDVVRHSDGRVYFAFRISPNHFASPDTVLYVLSSENETDWIFETSIHEGTDLREPRFLSFDDGRLFLYYALLGESSLDFEPQGSKVTERLAGGTWTEPEPVFEPGFIPWRARVIDGMAYLSGYVGGENIYDVNGEPLEVYFLTTVDGRSFTPVVPDQPVVLTGGTSETDFAFLDDGTLIAVARNEAGDAETGFGSKICRAEADDLGTWRCEADLRKYDSPLVFRHGPHVYLIARRNLTETGNYDLQSEGPLESLAIRYSAAYWQQPKRCSLWWIDPVALTANFVVDLPSRGDTCFASILRVSDTEYTVYNYTSPLDGEDLSWLRGQQGETQIYRLSLVFE